MPAKWTAEIVGTLHLHGITAKQLAGAMGWNPKYLSQVLNGRKTPAKAEGKVRKALDELLSRQEPATETE